MSSKTEKKIDLDIETLAAPEVVRKAGQVQVSDFQLLSGALVQVGKDGRIYDTFKGRILKQIYKDVAFSAFRAYRNTSDTKETPIHDVQSAKLLALETSTSPYKDGIDASLADVVTIEPLLTHRPRSCLLFDILHKADIDEAITMEQAAIIKQQAMMEQAAYLALREKKTTQLAQRSFQRRISEGLNKLIVDDGEFDALFLTAASQFVMDYPNKFTNEEDNENIGIIQAALDFTGKSNEIALDHVSEITFDV